MGRRRRSLAGAEAVRDVALHVADPRHAPEQGEHVRVEGVAHGLAAAVKGRGPHAGVRGCEFHELEVREGHFREELEAAAVVEDERRAAHLLAN